MTSPTPKTRVDEFVEQLLAIGSAASRRRLIRQHPLSASELHDAVLLLVERAYELLGSDPKQMESVCVDALSLADRADDDFLRAMVHMRYADACAAQGRNAAACTHSDDARRLFTRLGRPVEAARTRTSWVYAMAAQGRFEEALAAARSARRVLVRHGEVRRVAALDLNTGGIYAQHGDYRSALRCFTRALSEFRQFGDAARTQLARCHGNRGRVLTILGRHQDAIQELERARDLFEVTGDRSDARQVERAIGDRQMEIGHYAAALQTYDRWRSAGGDDRADALVEYASNVATCYLRLNRPAEGLAILDQTEPELRRIDDPQLASEFAIRRVAARLLLEPAHVALDVIDDALDRYHAAAAQARTWLLVQRAVVLLRDRDAVDALHASLEATELARASGIKGLVVDGLNQQGRALIALGQFGEAGRCLDRARRIGRSIDSPAVLYQTYESLGLLAEAEGRLRTAERCYARAVRHLEREQRGVIFEFRDSFVADRTSVYERLARLHVESGRFERAWATVEQMKSRALIDAISGTVAVRPRGSPETRRLLRDLTRARERYAAASAAGRTEYAATPAGEEIPTEKLALERRIESLIQRLQVAGAADDLTTLFGIVSDTSRPSLEPDTMLLEFCFLGDDLLRFCADQTGIHGEILVGAVPQAERLVRAFRLNLDATAHSPPEDRARLAMQAQTILARLYTLLLDGISELNAMRALVVVPHGFLHYLPFHALYDGDRYLVERIAVSYAPSAAVYGVCRTRRQSSTTKPLILGYSAGGVLPYALEEVEAIGAILTAPVHREESARGTLLYTTGRRAGLIHIAAHGSFRGDAPLFSHIELADGPLTTADVFNLELRSGLVVLSACETGRAVVGGGDELAGITRAFLYAGASGLLVTQWRVEDVSTADIMSRFYEEVVQGTRTATALGKVQAASAAAHLHPYFWAAFQIIGDDRVIKF